VGDLETGLARTPAAFSAKVIASGSSSISEAIQWAIQWAIYWAISGTRRLR
jgi:hypothetical protein